MDIKKPPKKAKKLNGKVVLGLFFGITILSIALAFNTGSAISVAREDIIVSDVKRGNLEVIVEGYGHLDSNKKQLITALTQATVKEIFLKPGASVSKDSVIAVMENPELSQEVSSAEQELEQAKGNLRQLYVNQKREALFEDAEIAQLQAQYESAQLKRTAEEKLLRNGIVAEITYKESVLTEKQLRQRIEILKSRKKQLAKVHEEAINIQQEKIKQLEGSLAVANNRFNKLQVRAGIDGVLQTLSIELGQSLSAGQEIALIGSNEDLVALIKVPQSQANRIEQGQKAIVDTRQHEIAGVVKRIDPIVTEGTVEIEISLPLNLPSSARPQTSVDATVKTATLNDVLYIRRPANVREKQTMALFLLNDSGEKAELRDIKFGTRAGEHMEILSGASINQRYILSGITEAQKKNVNLLTIN